MSQNSAPRSQYGSLANVYDAFLTLTGFKRGVENFLERVDFSFSKGSKVLDAGAGTGLVALYLAKRFPDIEIYASDIDRRMLREMALLTQEEGIDNVRLFQNDLNTPEILDDFYTKQAFNVPPDFFDAVITSGALEHVPVEVVIPRLASLLRPGGMFLNLGVRRNPAGAVLAMVYKFKPHSLDEIRRICRDSGLSDIRTLRLTADDFPANLSRVAVIARKNVSR
ncbi:hypothetical protein A2757_01195 [Candidatus Giovannonibacteria bacterium RIFCSPHIGHO2_01_FULL_48_47]|nr:MAG: hypothetical protein A2757_01195 [Candidatus Giovannonibacteria bacterium RIFCSPHIGHO2_01_FULL_48_47]OGF67726.1 MAG: hypothetical protein A3D61_03700 [Candidatus Giovannonibacteria bacterium RIFCSPHIGHO2_02_FULL_48_15]OGF88034.1 MAG: hypothetical protein A3B26_00950 [Candidatus Giovannonibacteria bacterium RIFCSPLOWO2_01_FULL_48_47]OGF94844.1 MAG: hypothetical protein A2433_02430 [Candidatus Giovannonibacteria bacterium RIFOXYC1_FULL_48_8]OGF95875.1 MAG: hypothetical protein A2613_03600